MTVTEATPIATAGTRKEEEAPLLVGAGGVAEAGAVGEKVAELLTTGREAETTGAGGVATTGAEEEATTTGAEAEAEGSTTEVGATAEVTETTGATEALATV